MRKIDIITLDVFQGIIKKDNIILFKGEQENMFSLLSMENSNEARSLLFFKIIHTCETLMIDTILIFNSVKDALQFYISKDDTYFNNKSILITNDNSNNFAVQYIREKKIKNLVFYHRPNKTDLYFMYFELIGEKVNYKLAINDDKILTTVIYKNHNLILDVKQLPKAVSILGKDERFFRVKNVYLTSEKINSPIIW